tara:strand:- start:5086 stop:6120 length:1035 start_codon:yes stop_codon:yes gene_type:complete
MSTVIILTETILQLTYAVSIRDSCFEGKKVVIIWFGNTNVKKEYPMIFSKKNVEYIFIENPTRKNFIMLGSSIKNISSKVIHLKNHDCELITYYDTHPGFEIIKDTLSISWDRVGLIEDGTHNYLSNISMPAYQNRLVKHYINKILGRYPVNLSYYNLGGNKLIKLFYVMSPENAFVADPEQARVISIADDVKTFLSKIDIDVPERLGKIDVFLTLAPVYKYRRLNKEQLFSFIFRLIEKFNSKITVVKPHMKDSLFGIREDLSELKKEGIIIAPDIATEFLFKKIPETNWVGNVSTAMLNRHFLYPDYRDIFHIFDEGKSPTFEKEKKCMQKILKAKYKHGKF